MIKENIEIKITNNRKYPDLILLGCIIFLLIFGLIMVYSASFYTAQKDYGDSFFFLKRQAVGAVVGVVGMTFMLFFKLERLRKFKIYILIFAYILLLLVFVPFLSVEALGAKRWINLGFFTIQPSEIAKFAYVIFCAAYMDGCKKMKTIRGALPVILIGLSICVLIILEPNMSITMCVALTMVALLFIGGLSLKKMFLIVLPLAAAIPVLIVIEPYRMQRLLAFIDPWASPKDEGYQLIQSFYALGSGGWFGVGLFNSRQKFEFLPFSESDFIFSIIGEELGFLGSVFIIAVFVVVIFRGIKIAINAKNRYLCYLASGIVAVIAIQVLINIAVVSGSIPPTGLPLPFISYGGSSLVVFMSAAGILLNISRQKFSLQEFPAG